MVKSIKPGAENITQMIGIKVKVIDENKDNLLKLKELGLNKENITVLKKLL
jgi:hypothetical protein